ncbi:hypothetical protein M758_8G146400 [Ceratodon purpureus]|nr:hypothetical protein M758_8G146400 [Ceratodon purpureus]
MTRPPSCADEREQGLKKGPWTPDEDQKLVAYIQQHGHGSWRSLPINAGLQRCGKSCRLRWTNYLRPDIKRGRFSQEEDRMIVHLHAILGNRWSAIANHLPRRTDNEIKNYWNTHLKKRLLQMGIDPVTHKSTSTTEDLDSCSILPSLSRPVVSSTLSHMSQWECARAEAEARLCQQSATSPTSDFVQSSVPQQITFNTVNPRGTQDASTSFMTSWKAQVAETLRPSFGVVELDKTPANPVNLQSFLQDWESSLQGPQQPTSTSPGPFSAYDSPINFPDFTSSTASAVVSPQYTTPSHTLPSSAQITERLLASRGFSNDISLILPPPTKVSSYSLPGESNHFIDSPTSILQAPEYDSSYTNSPCVSSSGGDSFDLIAQSLGLINQENEQSRSGLNMFPAEPPFWSRQQVAMSNTLQPSEPYLILPQLNPPKPSFMLSQVEVPNNIPIPQFDFLC